MKKPEVDYRKLRLNNICTPTYRHLFLLLGWVIYFALYFLTENLIPREICAPVHCGLDDLIPFCEWFLIPYVGWYGLVVFSLGYFLLYDVDSFKRLQGYIIVTQLVAMTVYILFPNRQDLRPEVLPRDNLLSRGVELLYAFDTSTNVCPSLHVGYSLGIASVWIKQKNVAVIWRIAVVIAVVLICLSTVFIKQHSALDGLAAVGLGVLAEIIVYGKDWWLPRLRKKT